MMNTTHPILIMMAALVWYTGVIVLSLKSSGLLTRAHDLGIPLEWIVAWIILGILIGVVKSKYLFVRICKSNLNRIKALEKPKLWQFYRKRFFIFLFLMVTMGNILATMAQDHREGLVSLAVLEISIATALGLSSLTFFKRK